MTTPRTDLARAILEAHERTMQALLAVAQGDVPTDPEPERHHFFYGEKYSLEHWQKAVELFNRQYGDVYPLPHLEDEYPDNYTASKRLGFDFFARFRQILEETKPTEPQPEIKVGDTVWIRAEVREVDPGSAFAFKVNLKIQGLSDQSYWVYNDNVRKLD